MHSIDSPSGSARFVRGACPRPKCDRDSRNAIAWGVTSLMSWHGISLANFSTEAPLLTAQKVGGPSHAGDATAASPRVRWLIPGSLPELRKRLREFLRLTRSN